MKLRYIKQIPVGYVEDEPIEIMKEYNIVLVLQRTQLDGLKEFSVVGDYWDVNDFINNYYDKNGLKYLKSDNIEIKPVKENAMKNLIHCTFEWSVGPYDEDF